MTTITVKRNWARGGQCTTCTATASRNPHDGSYFDSTGRKQGTDGHWHSLATRRASA